MRTGLPAHEAHKIGRVRENALYDEHAESYARHSEQSPVNAYYDRPAILALAGEIDGKDVLELGCAAGVLSERLVDRGARLLGLDGAERMIELARRRLGGRARFEVADLADPLDSVPDASIDLVVASLVLHYLEDWAPLLAEVHRCLVPGGGLVFSVHHPAADWHKFTESVYQRTELVSEVWEIAGHQRSVSFYRRPLAAMFDQLRRAGFTVDVVDEPEPLPELEELAPEAYQQLTTEPIFLFVRARA